MFAAGIALIDISSSSVTNNAVTFMSGTVPAGKELTGVSLSGASSTNVSDAITVTGNHLTSRLESPAGDVAGLFMQWSTNWNLSQNTIDGFAYGFDFLNQPGTQMQLDAILSGNTLTSCGAPDRLQNGSF